MQQTPTERFVSVLEDVFNMRFSDAERARLEDAFNDAVAHRVESLESERARDEW